MPWGASTPRFYGLGSFSRTAPSNRCKSSCFLVSHTDLAPITSNNPICFPVGVQGDNISNRHAFFLGSSIQMDASISKFLHWTYAFFGCLLQCFSPTIRKLYNSVLKLWDVLKLFVLTSPSFRMIIRKVEGAISHRQVECALSPQVVALSNLFPASSLEAHRL